jgi:hypothetical protein
MSVIKNINPKATRPCEYVAFFTMEVPTLEVPVFVYLACDAVSQYCFNTGFEKDESPANILKHIYLLTEHEAFLLHRDKGFTIVLNRFEELSDRIEPMIRSVNGRLLYNKKFHSQIARPVRSSFKNLLLGGNR